jgi:hypothetical protein
METELKQPRSLSSCIKAGYSFFITNFKSIFSATWLSALAYAITVAFLCLLIVPSATLVNAANGDIMTTIALIILVVILYFVASVWFATNVVGIFNGQAFKSNMHKVIVVALIYGLMAFVYSFLHGFTSGFFFGIAGFKVTALSAVMTGFINLLLLAVYIIVIVPFMYSAFKYIMQPEEKVKAILGKNYVVGLRHWGFLFSVGFVVTILTTIVGVIIFIPFLIIFAAQSVSQLGAMDGDATGMPGYFPYLMFFVSIITFFALTYLMIFINSVQYYVYGSIEAREEEKRKFIIKKDNGAENIVY